MKNLYTSILVLFFPIVAFAQNTEADETTIADTCVAAEGLIDKIILYGAPIIITVVAAIFISKSWGQKAVDNRSEYFMEHERAGKALGLLLGSLTFSSMLYVTSTQYSKAGTVMSTASCYPDGWNIVAGIFFVVSLILFIVAYVAAK